MWLWWMASAGATDATVLLHVVDPKGEVRFERELPAPVVKVFDFNDGKRAYQVAYRAETDPEISELKVDATLQLVKKSGPKERKRAQITLPENQPHEATLADPSSEGSWRVTTRWVRSFGPAPQAPEPTATDRFIMLWDDTPLRPDPRDKTEVERIRELPEGRLSPWDQASPFRAIHSFGSDWMEVETVPEDYAPHCYTGGTPAREQPFQHYARLEHALDVAGREVSVDFPDGTGFVIAAGTIVRPNEEIEGMHTVLLPEVRFDVQMPQGTVGKLYTPSGHFPTHDGTWRVQAGDDGVIGELAGGRKVRWTGAELPVVQGRVGVTSPLVTLRTPCSELRLRVSEEQLVAQ